MSATWSMWGRHLLLAQTLTPELVADLSGLQLALTRSVPVANASPSQLLEPNTGGYARVAYGIGGAYWRRTGFGEYQNTQSLSFPEITASWGLIVGWALVVPAADQCLAMGSIKDPFVGVVGMLPVAAPGVLLLGNYD